MIAATDSVTLAPGVEIRQELLRDVVRGHEWPLNTSGAFVLERSGRPLGEVAGELADAFSLSAPEARGDVLRFVWQLNHLALVNVERTASSLGSSSSGCGSPRDSHRPEPCRHRSRADGRSTLGRSRMRLRAPSWRCCRAWPWSRPSRPSSRSTLR